VSSGRLEHALAAFLRQEFGASVAAIMGFVEILIDDARRPGLEGCLPDLERMRSAATQLSTLVTQAVDAFGSGPGETATFRHDIRTPLSAIKGYGELLVEEAQDRGQEALQQDLAKVVDLADRLLGEIDRLVAAPVLPIDVVGNVLRAIKPLDVPDIVDRSAASGRILVVDDNASNRDLLSRRLAREGYRVTTAEDAAAAFARIAYEAFDLVLLDLMMPGISGFEALCRLKSEPSTRHIPVIVI
jgi:hypothetical protein